MRIPFVLILFAALAIPSVSKLGQSAPQSRTPQPSFTITIASPQKIVRAGSEVHIEYSLRNTSTKQLVFSKFAGSRDYNFQVVVQDADGKEPLLKAESVERALREGGLDLPMGSVHHYYVERGESVKDEVILTKVYDLTAPGKYTIQVQRKDETSNNAIVKSNTITVTVTP